MADDDIDMAAALMEEEEKKSSSSKPTSQPGAEFANDQESLDAVYGIDVDVVAVLGTAMMPINQVLKLGRGAVVQLDRMVEEDIDLYANNILIAKGEVVVTDDRLGVSLSKVIKSNIKAL
ncbi:MAG: FliM/FliN family flagellar motor switch protein [Rhodospirillales bacterium]